MKDMNEILKLMNDYLEIVGQLELPSGVNINEDLEPIISEGTKILADSFDYLNDDALFIAEFLCSGKCFQKDYDNYIANLYYDIAACLNEEEYRRQEMEEMFNSYDME